MARLKTGGLSRLILPAQLLVDTPDASRIHHRPTRPALCSINLVLDDIEELFQRLLRAQLKNPLSLGHLGHV